MKKRVFILRHAHRDTSQRESDNGLSAKGWEQAKALQHLFRITERERSLSIFTSPKKRCQETVELLSKFLQTKSTILSLLNEQQADESGGQFEKRIYKLKEWCTHEAPPLTVLCSHGDVIPVLLEYLIGIPVPLKKGGFVELQLREDEFQLMTLVQDPLGLRGKK